MTTQKYALSRIISGQVVSNPSRRSVIGGLAAIPSLGLAAPSLAGATPKIVIIGGGFGGASAAMHMRKIAPHIDVTLIERNAVYTACPFSNLVIAGERDISRQIFQYKGLEKAGVTVIQDEAKMVNQTAKSIDLKNGSAVSFDRLILSPGIDFIWNQIEGYDQAASQALPHAWKAGSQTTLLKRQLTNLRDGGTVVMAIPPAPFRCPPGPYERASLIAHFLKTRKPKSKLLLLDAQDRFSKQPLFQEAWAEKYADIIERVPGSESGQVIRVDPKTKTLFTDFDEFKADVANVIPPQQAGKIAQIARVTDGSKWCPINAVTFESTLVPHIHIIGDATIAAPMPKSAFSANLQGKICAAQVALLLAGKAPIPTTLSNTCYSYAAPDDAFSVSGVYHNKSERFEPVPGAGGISPIGNFPDLRQAESLQALDWFNTITREAFG